MKRLLTLLLLPAITLAQIPDPLPNTYVDDLAGVLTTYQVGKINEQVHQLETKYSVQLAIVLVGDLPTNYEIEDYAREIGRKWHVGNARNGLVYVAAINQHKQRLEVAANLEGLIPDITARHLTDNIKPFFRNKDYATGLLNMVKEIDDLINSEAQEQRKLAEEERNKKSDNTLLIGLLLIVCFIGPWIIAVWIINRRKKKRITPEPKYSPSTIASRYAGSSNYVAPVIVNNENNYSSGYSKSDDDDRPSYRSSSSDSGSSSNSDYGNWGSGSSDSGSSDSGFSGGGSSNDW